MQPDRAKESIELGLQGRPLCEGPLSKIQPQGTFRVCKRVKQLLRRRHCFKSGICRCDMADGEAESLEVGGGPQA